MTANLIPNILASLLFLVGLFVAMRAFYVYYQARNSRLFILGLSMGIIALTAAADFISSNVSSITLNTDWFLFIGQTASLLFIFLSLLRDSDQYLRGLMIWQVCVSALLAGLLLLSPALPPFPNTALEAVLSGSRFVVSFGIFFCYASAFLKKETRFSLLMGLSFLLLALGYLMIFQKYLVNNPTLFDNIGDATRMVGLVVLFVTIFLG